MVTLLTPRQVDLIFRYPRGRTLRLAKAGKIECITLPDGEIRIKQETVDRLLQPSLITQQPREVANVQ